MLRVTIEMLPGGDEARATTLEVIEIAQVRRYDDDPNGGRGYLWRDEASQPAFHDVLVTHQRGDGAAVLVAKVLEARGARPHTNPPLI